MARPVITPKPAPPQPRETPVTIGGYYAGPLVVVLPSPPLHLRRMRGAL